jgi:hypothetical protein
MTTKLLSDVGEALYGPRWHTDLSRDLGVADRTMRRWMAGGAANVASHKRAHWVIWAAMALLLVIIFGLAASIGPFGPRSSTRLPGTRPKRVTSTRAMRSTRSASWQ